MLDPRLLLGLRAGAGRLGGALGVLLRRLLGGLAGSGLGLRRLLGGKPFARGGLGRPGLLERGLLGQLALAAARQTGVLGRAPTLGQLGDGLLGREPRLVRLLGGDGVLASQLVRALPCLVGPLGGLLGGQPVGRLLGGRLLGDPAHPGRMLGRARVLEQPRLDRLDVKWPGARDVVVRCVGELVGSGGRRGRMGIGRSSHCARV